MADQQNLLMCVRCVEFIQEVSCTINEFLPGFCTLYVFGEFLCLASELGIEFSPGLSLKPLPRLVLFDSLVSDHCVSI